jgi:serine/threonine-protein kinase
MPAPAFDPFVGRLVAGRFRVLGVLGQGGMGAVYRAEHVAMGRQVALKVIHAHIARDPTVRARFHREAKAASRLESPLVVTPYDFGETEDGTLYFAMELVRGESIRARLERDCSVPVREALAIAGDIARALTEAHAAGVVHRDLKPENVMLLEGGGLKVVDLGIARVMEASGVERAQTQLTRSGALLGTPAYMSPEAVKRTQVGPPADLYALGLILHEMIAGRPTFDEAEPVLLMGMHLRVRPEPLSAVREDLAIPTSLDALVSELLAKATDARPASAAQVAERLRAIEEELRAPAPEQARRRVPWAVVAASVVGVAVVAAAIVLSSEDEHPRIEPLPPSEAPSEATVQRQPAPAPAPMPPGVPRGEREATGAIEDEAARGTDAPAAIDEREADRERALRRRGSRRGAPARADRMDEAQPETAMESATAMGAPALREEW